MAHLAAFQQALLQRALCQCHRDLHFARDHAHARHYRQQGLSDLRHFTGASEPLSQQRASVTCTASAKGLAGVEEDTSLQPRSIQWFPGHIASAEKALKVQLNTVDVVLEVRDARIPLSTRHQSLPGWVGNKPHLLLLNRRDQVSAADRAAWASHFRSEGQTIYWTDSRTGTGVRQVMKAAIDAGASINIKRARRGLRPRPLKAAVVGFPNVGKSALINRLLGRALAPSAPRAGVTRQLKWVRLGGDLDLLDTPGVLPMSLRSQTIAQRLAVCNDIGEASYENSLVAAAMVDSMMQLPTADAIADRFVARYKIDPAGMSGDSYTAAVADKLYGNDSERAGQRLLKDYRLGALGVFAIERPQ